MSEEEFFYGLYLFRLSVSTQEIDFMGRWSSWLLKRENLAFHAAIVSGQTEESIRTLWLAENSPLGKALK